MNVKERLLDAKIRRLNIFGWIFYVLGGLVILLGIGLLSERIYFRINSNIAVGTILRAVEVRQNKTDTYSLLISFADQDGLSHELSIDEDAPAGPFVSGGRVSIAYDRRNPDNARLYNLAFFLTPFLALFGGLVFGTAHLKDRKWILSAVCLCDRIDARRARQRNQPSLPPFRTR